MRKIALMLSLLFATSSYAKTVDNLASAFSEGELDARVRFQYFNTNWDDNDWGVGADDKDSKAGAIGGSLIYKTAPFYGLSAGAGFYTTHNISTLTRENGAKNTTSADLFAREKGTKYGDSYSMLAQAYLNYDVSKSSIKAGRFLMNNPWITPNDTKMIPVAVQGLSINSKEIGKTTIFLDYANKIKERGKTHFGSMADTLDTPVAIKNYYATQYTGNSAGYGEKKAKDVVVLGVKNNSVENLELQVWDMHWSDIVNQALLEANYSFKIGDIGTKIGARYIHQFDDGAGDIIKPRDGSVYDSAAVKFKGDSNNKVDTNLIALRAIFSYGSSEFLLSYSHTSSGGDLIAPWRGFPTAGYTRSMSVTDWNANTNAYKVGYEQDFNSLLKGLSTILSYNYYDRDPSKVGYQSATQRGYGNGDTHQANLDVIYKVASLKGLELKARYMIQDNQEVSNIAGNSGKKSHGYTNDTSNHELRLEANYFF